jgi:hypothetical protein
MAHTYSVGQKVNIEVDKISNVAAKKEGVAPGDLREAVIDATVDHEDVLGNEVPLYDVSFTNVDLAVKGIREEDIEGLSV